MSLRLALMTSALGAVLVASFFPWRQLPPFSEDPTRPLLGEYNPWQDLDSSWSIGRIEFYKVYPALSCIVAVGCITIARRRLRDGMLSRVGSLAACLAVCQLFASVALVAQDDLWRSTVSLIVATLGAFVILVCALCRDEPAKAEAASSTSPI
jgi:uncharacterized membrane protein YhaH (DUF805 family)